MKQDAWQRDSVRYAYESRYREPGADFERAERRRSSAYLEAIDLAYLMRAAGQDFELKARQLPLL